MTFVCYTENGEYEFANIKNLRKAAYEHFISGCPGAWTYEGFGKTGIIYYKNGEVIDSGFFSITAAGNIKRFSLE